MVRTAFFVPAYTDWSGTMRSPAVDDGVDEVPEALLAEDRQRRGDAVQDALEVDVDHLLPVLDAQVVQRGDQPDPGVADEDVELAVALACQRDQAGEVLAPRHVRAAQAASPPACSMRAASASRRSGRRAPSTTFAPRSASSSAVASPMPLLAPVMATTLPSIM